MGTPKRVNDGGMVFHALNRANARSQIFHKPEDYESTTVPDTFSAPSIAGLTPWETLYVSAGNKAELTLAPASGAILPTLISYRVTPSSGALPSTGTFGGSKCQIAAPSPGAELVVEVGFDENQNGTIEQSEYSLSFAIRTISLTGALLTSARTAGGPIENAFAIHISEHFDIGSTFEFGMVPGAGVIPNVSTPGMVKCG